MAHRDDRSYYRAVQAYYRPKHSKVLKALAWLIILFVILCVLAPLIGMR